MLTGIRLHLPRTTIDNLLDAITHTSSTVAIRSTSFLCSARMTIPLSFMKSHLRKIGPM